MSAKAFLIAFDGADHALLEAGTPQQVSRSFKSRVVSHEGDDERLYYFDTRGRVRQKRFRKPLEENVVEPVSSVGCEQDEDEPKVKSKGRPPTANKKTTTKSK
jgi:hypothetical protein